MTARLFFLISALAFALTARAASTISFKDITSTNVVKTNDLFLLDSDLGGGNYATRTAPIALLPSGGDTIWTNYTIAGFDGNDVNITIDTKRPFLRFASNNLVSWGSPAGVTILGVYDTSTFEALAKTTGDLTLLGRPGLFTSTNGGDIYGFGEDIYASATFDAANDIHATGDACFMRAYLSNVFNIDAIGFSALSDCSIVKSRGVIGVGPFSMSGLTSSNAPYCSAFGNGSLSSASLTNCSEIVAIGGALISAVLNDSTEVVGIGSTAAGISGSFTNIVLIGDSATVSGSTGKDKIITGPAMDLQVGQAITTGGDTNRWIFKGLTVDGGGVTNVNYSVNGTNLTMGNVTSAGASTPGQILVLTGTNGTSVVPTNWPSGGDTIWLSNTNIDMEGGPIYSLTWSNALSPQSVSFAVNYLTNFEGSVTESISIGAETPDPATFAANSVNVFNYGWRAGQGMVTTNADDIYNFGDNAGREATFSIYATDIYNFGDYAGAFGFATNCLGIYNFGHSAGQSMQSWQSHELHNFGDNAGINAYYTNATSVFNIGGFAGQYSVSDSSTGIYAIGETSGKNLTTTNSTDIYAFAGGLQASTLTDSKRVVSIGKSGAITGSYTNIVLVGDGATIGATGKDQFILGPNMTLSTGGDTNRWIFKGLTVDGGTTNAHCSVNGTNFFWALTPE